MILEEYHTGLILYTKHIFDHTLNTVSKHGVHIMQGIDMLEKIQYRALKLVPQLSNLPYKEWIQII